MEGNGVVLISGASGLLGRALMTRLSENKAWNNVCGIAFSRSGPQLEHLDLTNLECAQEFVKKKQPQYLIHAAAQRMPDKVEEDPEGARLLNVEATRSLAQAIKNVNGRMLYISTDYVFDGKVPPYDHLASTNPLNTYGILKRDGEIVVLETDPDNFVLRIPILYGDVEYLAESAITVLFKKLLEVQSEDSDKVEMSHYEIRRPSHVRDIAAICDQLLSMHFQNPSSVKGGIYQWCGDEAMTKYSMVSDMAEVFNLNMDHIIPNDQPSGGAPRPYDTTMKCDRLKSLGISEHTTFKDGLKSCLSKWA